MKWFIKVLKEYAVFNGRAGRQEYWYFVLFYFFFSIVIGFIDGLFIDMDILPFAFGNNGYLGLIYILATIVPFIAVQVRRLHDIDRSGWWIFLIFLPILGWIALIIFSCLKGKEGENNFGSDSRDLYESKLDDRPLIRDESEVW